MKKLCLLIPALISLTVSQPVLAQPLPRVAAPEAGFSAEGLARLDSFFEREIQANRVPGAVVAIARDGKLATAAPFVAIFASG